MKDFHNGRKNNHRSRVWNEIARRVKDRKNATVLYLPGEKDLDRREAVRRGFSPDNLIAVEIDKDVAIKLRKNHKNVIVGSLSEVLLLYGKVIDVVIADMFCGLSNTAERLMLSFSNSPALHENSVLYLNLKRGRDSFHVMNEFIKLRHGCPENEKEILNSILKNPFMHRGEIAWQYLTILEVERGEYFFKNKTEYRNADAFTKFINLLLFFKTHQKPIFDSYKSGNQYMDSVLYTKMFDNGLNIKDIKSLKVYSKYKNDMDKVTAKISATLATQTKRKTGKLQHSPHF